MGGKSQALLAMAAMYVDKPTYKCLLFRRTYADLSKPNAIMDRAKQWWMNKPGIKWSNEQHTFTFPSGARIAFAYVRNMQDALNHNSAEYHTIGGDELHLIQNQPAIYLMSRIRRLANEADIPLRFRSGWNPPVNQEGAWVKERYLTREALECQRKDTPRYFKQVWWKDGRAFIPARLQDNPHGDAITYRQSLEQLDPVTKKQLEDGDMSAHGEGRFSREWFPRFTDIGDALITGTRHVVNDNIVLYKHLRTMLIIDPANRPGKNSKNTSFLIGSIDNKSRFYIRHVLKRQIPLEEIIPQAYQLACFWRPLYVGIEANGFQIGLVNEARDRVKYPKMPIVKELDHEGKSKLTRATPAIHAASQAQIYVPFEADWLEDYFSELELFTGDDKLDVFTDQVDTTAYLVLENGKPYSEAQPFTFSMV